MQKKDKEATAQKAPKKNKKKKDPYRKPRSGDVIDGRYRVVGRPLGKGGMGTVYRIQDEAGVMYALKRLDPALREEKRFEKRFRLEYEATAQLRHPNITQYQELFEADGALHIRMELVEGINLRQLLKKQKRLPLPIAAGVAQALARALEHLHLHRVVHRDIKPENVLIGRDGTVKLTDFGISRLEYAAITRTGTILGTPRYMSPEQLAGKKGEEIGPESDLYSLGVVLYEMILGKDPYRLRQKAEVLEVINIKHNKEPKPLPKEIKEDVRTLVMDLMKRDPAQRPSDAKVLSRELGRWAAPRKELRQAMGEWADMYGANQPAPKLAAPKRKRESFWEGQPSSKGTQAPESTLGLLPTTQGRELLPAFAATALFLFFLWGFGFFYQRQETHASASLKRVGEQTQTQALKRRTDHQLKLLAPRPKPKKRARKRKRRRSRKRRRRSRRYRRKRRRRRSRKRRRRSRRSRRYRRRRRTRRRRRSRRRRSYRRRRRR